jgi:hypothetical protein
VAAFPTVETYLTYEQVFASEVSRSDIESWVSGLSLDDCLQTVGKLSSSVSTGRMTSAEIDRMLAGGLGDRADRARALIAAGHRFAFQTRLSTLARVALEVAERRPADAFAHGAEFGLFARALLGIADVFDPVGAFGSGDVTAVGDAFSRMMLRRLATRVDVPLDAQLARYWRVFVELPAQRPDLLVAGEDFDARLGGQTGLTVRQYIAVCFGLYIRFMMFDLKGSTDWTVDAGYWAKTRIDPQRAQAAIALLSATPDEFTAMFRAQEAEGFGALDDLRPFALKPLCEIWPGRHLPVEVDMLGPRLVGDGLYWRLHPGARSTDIERSRYGASVGHMLEEHLAEVAASVYPPTQGAQRLWREIEYGGGHGPDLVIRDGERTVFVEIGGERVNALKTLFRGDLDAYQADVTELLVKHRVEQLDRKITDTRDGRLRFGNATPHELGVIHPVVCLLDGFPIAPTLRERIDSAVADAGYLQQPNLGRLEIVSADELEALFAEVDRTNATVSSVLSEFALDVDLRRWTIRDFLIARRGGVGRTRFVEQQWRRITSEIRTELFGKQRA